MKEKPFVSVIILNYNGKRFLERCLSSVFETDYPNFEVILVDNASTDESVDLVEKLFAHESKLKIVKNQKNLGFGPANNIGFTHAIGDYIVFLNNDTAVDTKWLMALVDAMEKDPTIGLAQSMIFSMDSQNLQTAGWLLGDYLVFMHSITLENLKRNHTKQLPDVFEISYASGTAMITKREVTKMTGLFDPKYFWFYDDNYLSFKMWLVGKRVVTVAESRVQHVGGGTAGFDSPFIRQHGTICLVSLIFNLYWNSLELIKALFIFNYNLIITSLKEIIEHQKTTRFWANIAALFWILRNLKYIWKNRLKYLKKAKISQKELLSKFIRIHLPDGIYLVPPPSKLLLTKMNKEIMEYENTLASFF